VRHTSTESAVSLQLKAVLIRAAPEGQPPKRQGLDRQRDEVYARRVQAHCRRKQNMRHDDIVACLPEWSRDDASTSLRSAPVSERSLSMKPHTVTVLPDREGRYCGTRTKCTLLCKWKAVAIRAVDRKMGAQSVSKVTSVIDRLAFAEPTAGFAPPGSAVTRKAELSVDMAVLIHQLRMLNTYLENPATRLSWAMDSTPAFGRDRQVTSVLASEVLWGEVNPHDGLKHVEVRSDLVILPVQVVLGKSPSAVRCGECFKP
jgi:hypothetical protein